MIAKLSCELPKADPFFSLMPTTRKCSVPILTILSSGSTGPNTLSATSHPSTATGRLAVDLGGADQPAALDVEGREIDVVPRHAADLDAIDLLVAVADARPRERLRGDRADVVAVLADRGRLAQRDARVVADALLVGLGAHHRHALNREVVGADARHDRVGDVGVHSLNQRHHRDDRRDRDDVPEHGQERAELVRPDRLQGDRR